MSQRHTRNSDGLPDEYGPLTDLIFSLFAVAVLLLGIVGTNGNITRQSLSDRLAAKDQQATELQNALDTSRAELAAERTPQNATVPPPQPATRAEDIEKLRLQLAELQREKEEWLSAEEREAELTPVYGRLEFDRLIYPAEGSGGFLRNGIIDEIILEEIRTLLGEEIDELSSLGANRILMEIDIAGTYRAGKEGDRRDPDYEQALATASALTSALRLTPMPIACIVPVPYGKSRSGAVTVFTAKPAMNARLEAFERRDNNPDLAASRELLARIAADDTRIRIVAEHVYTSPCASEDLLDSIILWNRGELQDSRN